MEDTLMHYGILGMKWGVRRTPNQLGRKTRKKTSIKNMTDTELKAKVTRLNLEAQYKKLNKSNGIKSKLVKAGKAAALAYATIQINNIAKNTLSKDGQKIVSVMLNAFTSSGQSK